MFQFPEKFPESLKKYHLIMVETFLREWQFLMAVLDEQALPRTDFNTKLLDYFKKSIEALEEFSPFPGVKLTGTLINKVIKLGNKKRQESQQHYFFEEYYKKKKIELRALIEIAALEACYRYQYIISTYLKTDDDAMESVVLFAKVGVRRMLEYLIREKLPAKKGNLIDGLIAGHSGAGVSGFSNTRLKLNEEKSKKEKSETSLPRVETKITHTAEDFYGRTGLITKEQKLYVLSDKSKARHKVKKSKEYFFNYGYTKLTKGTQDPKYGYTFVFDEKDVEKIYGNVSYLQQREELSATLQVQLNQFCPVIVAIDKQDLTEYVEYVDKQNKNKSTTETLSLLEYIRKHKPTLKADNAQYILYASEDRDLSLLLENRNLYKANFDDCSFSNCIFAGSLEGTSFRKSDLRYSNFERVKTARRIDLRGAYLEFCQASGLDLTGASLSQSNWSSANLTGAKLKYLTENVGSIWCNTQLDKIEVDNPQDLEDIKKIQEQQQKKLEELDVKLNTKITHLEESLESHYEQLNQLRQEDAEKNAERIQSLESLITLRLNGIYMTIQHYTEESLVVGKRMEYVEITQEQQSKKLKQLNEKREEESSKSKSKFQSNVSRWQRKIEQLKKDLSNRECEFQKLEFDTHETLNKYKDKYLSIYLATLSSIDIEKVDKEFSEYVSECKQGFFNISKLREKTKEIVSLKQKFEEYCSNIKELLNKQEVLLQSAMKISETLEQGKQNEIESTYKNYNVDISNYSRLSEEVLQKMREFQQEINKQCKVMEKFEKKSKNRNISLNKANKTAEQLNKVMGSTTFVLREKQKINYKHQEILRMRDDLLSKKGNIKIDTILAVLEQLNLYYLHKDARPPYTRTKVKSRNKTIKNLLETLQKLACDDTKEDTFEIMQAVTNAMASIETSKLDPRSVSEESSLLYRRLKVACCHIENLIKEKQDEISKTQRTPKQETTYSTSNLIASSRGYTSKNSNIHDSNENSEDKKQEPDNSSQQWLGYQ